MLQSILLIAVICMSSLSKNAYAIDLQEDSIKALYLYNFSKYTFWPEEKNSNTQDSIIFCIHDSKSIYTELVKAKSKSIHGKGLKLIFSEALEDLSSCHLLYSPIVAPEQINRLISEQTLIVGEDRENSIIAFHKEQNRLGFRVNLELADKASIVLSSELLKLATEVEK